MKSKKARIFGLVAFALVGAVVLGLTRASDQSSSNRIDVSLLNGITSGNIQKNAGRLELNLQPTITPSPSVNTKKLILFEATSGVPIDYLVANSQRIDSLPFDGVGISAGNVFAVTSPSLASKQYFSGVLAPLSSTNFSHLKNNFVMQFAGSPGNIDNWNQHVIPNFANLAEAAAETDLVGIFFDGELYDGANMWTPSASCPGKNLDQCREAMRQAGKTTMLSIASKWPTAQVMTTRTISLGDPLTGPAVSSAYTICPYNDWSNDSGNQMQSAFYAGLLEGSVGNQTTYIDGGEDYDVHDNASAQAFYSWRKTGQVTANSPKSVLVPDSIRSKWSNKISVAMGSADDIWCQSDGTRHASTAQNIQNDQTVMLKYVDEYSWLFGRIHNWTGANQVSTAGNADQSFIDAVKSARTANNLATW